MDARKCLVVLCVLALLSATGCELFGWRSGGVDARSDSSGESSSPAPVHAANELTPADDDSATQLSAEDQLVLEYVDNVNGAAQQPNSEPDFWPPPVVSARRPIVPPAPSDDGGATAATPDPALVIEDDPPAATAATEAPMLVGLSVNGAIGPLPAASNERTPDASANEGAFAALPPASLDEMLEKYFSADTDESFRAQYDLRVARVLAGDYSGAREPLQMVTAEQQELARRLIDVQIAVREAHQGNWPEGSTRALEEIEPLLDTLRETSELSIPALVLCRRVNGFGSYVPYDPPEFTGGAPIAFATYCEVDNLVSEARDDGLVHSELAMSTTVLTRAGDTVVELKDNDITDSCRRRRSDFFIAREVHLPGTLSPGEYVVNVSIKDKLGQKVAEGQTSFRVVVSR